MLRHSAATHWIREGVDRDVVQKLLGHASPLSMDRYRHVDESETRAAVDRAQAWRGGPVCRASAPAAARPAPTKATKKSRETWLRAHIDPAWRPGEWASARWGFTKDLTYPRTLSSEP
ncbi:tyrosine-type recombinase/integrase [Streptomyces sp. Vc74B-19]|uniref:tyrosine-type recombinase/integrase n=1 Tax=Streptomyces sp. Vc74B-19 TaxID=2741324 RepID=UPI00203AD8FE|nr:tyrosine-type recombinase/integrase [Streptomyces sp. Vc74B-19]